MKMERNVENKKGGYCMNIMRKEMNRKIRRRFCSATLAAVLGFTSVFAGNTDWIGWYKVTAATEDIEKVTEEAEQVSTNSYGLCDNTKDGAILHAFCWSFNTIKSNMKDIAEAGYTTVQTSPINECNATHPGMKLWSDDNGTGGCWWWHYQPTDWTIGNYQLGTRDDYIAMCDEADKYGVKIISDVLPNHTTPDLSQVSENLKNAAGGGGAGQLYHSNGFNPIGNYSDRTECTLGQMGGLPDVNTENQGFQKYYLEFCNDVIACGGDGFRYDTAKHIGVHSDPIDSSNTRGVNDFWDVATGLIAVDGVKLNKPDNFFIYGEVLQDNGIPYDEYASYMNMTASSYGYILRDALGGYSLNTGTISDWSHSTPDKIVTWVESHDTYCNDHDSAWMNDWQIRAGWAVIAARANGTPLFFSRPDGSDGSNKNYWGNNVLGAKGNDQFKHPEVAACNHFRNAMVGETEYLSNPNGNSSVLVIERGTKGAVIINMGSSTSNIPLNRVADGTYTEEVSGQTVQVSGGTLNYTVPGGTIAVVYNPTAITKDPTVSVSKDSGTFTEPFTLTLTPSNATKATYSIDGGEVKEFTSKTTVKIGEGCSIGDKVTVKVTAEGEGTPFEKTYTYTMAEAPEAKFMVRVKKSDFSSAPYIYAFSGGTVVTEYAGAWPGTKMTEDGDYYVFTSDSTESATVILHDNGSWRNTQEGETEVVVTGMMEYDKSSNKFTTITTPAKTTAPVKTDPPATQSPTPTPTEKPTVAPTAKATEAPTPTAKVTEAPVEGPQVSASLENGAVFKTETQDVKLTFKNATEVTYSVDGGPKKTVDATKNQNVTVTLGQGKIANREVTLEVESTNGSKTNKQTFTYTKEFVKSAGTVKALSTFAASVLEKITETAETVSTEAVGGKYATNPNKSIGKEATITIDGKFDDWSEDMLIAQGLANDSPVKFKGDWENCVIDSYALYGAWDDENIYIAWQNVNTADVTNGQGAAIEDGKLGNLPCVLAIDTGSGKNLTGKMDNGNYIWDTIQIDYTTPVDYVFMMAADGTGTPGIFTSDGTGATNYKANCGSFEDEGVEFMMGDGCFPKQLLGIKNIPGTPEGVAMLYDDSVATEDLMPGHNTSLDTFFEIKIPYKALGITKESFLENGIGVMQIQTRGESGMDCVPHDPSMLDNVFGDYANEPSNSHEKDDIDNITVPLAALGSTKAIGSGGGSSVATPAPDKTTAPSETPSKTETPASAAPDKTTEPSKTAAPTQTAATDEKIYCVNFGADKSSPQLNTTSLTLKAEVFDGTEPYTYEFLVDGAVVQQASSTDSYVWKNAAAGEHTIKVVVKDKDGNETSSEKAYVIEEEKGIDLPTPDLTETPKATEKINPTENPTETVTPTATSTVKPTDTPANPTVTAPVTEQPGNDPSVEDIEVTLTTNKKSSQVKGTKITISASVNGGSGNYKYSFMVENSSGTITSLASNSTKSSVTWTPAKKGTYKLSVIVEDVENGTIGSDVQSYKITAKAVLKYNSFKASKKKVKVKKKVTLTASGTAGQGKVKYRFYYKKKGTKKKIVLHKYSTTKKIKWTVPSKKGTYYVYCKIKDGSGKTLCKRVTIKVTKK